MLFGMFKTLNECKWVLLVEEERDQYYYDREKDEIIPKQKDNK